MKLVGLISGGKDSIYNLISCVEYGHEIVCLANLYPPPSEQTDELNSHMFQTVGHEVIEMIAEAMALPLIRHPISGKSIITSLHYETTSDQNISASHDTTIKDDDYDEIDDLYQLLVNVKEKYPDVQGVAAGAILSNYQRIRVERICGRLGLTCYGYLWQRDQVELLNEMCHGNANDENNNTKINEKIDKSKITPILIKLATPNLPPRDNLMLTLRELEPKLIKLFDEYGMNVCGEGGEYESLVINSCLNKSNLKIDSHSIYDNDTIGPNGEKMTHLQVPYGRIDKCHLEPKTDDEISNDKLALFKPYINLQCENIKYCTQIEDQDDYVVKSIVHEVECKCHQRPQYPTPIVSTIIPTLRTLDDQLRSNIDMIRSSSSKNNNNNNNNSTPHLPLVSRCFLQSVEITPLFNSLTEFIKMVDDEYNITIRPTFVMICIPDMKDFAAMNKQYSTIFPKIRPPARVCVQSALPYYTLDVIFTTTSIKEEKEASIINNNDGDRKILHSSSKNKISKFHQNISSCHVEGISTWAPANIGPYSQYWRLNGVFLGAGQIGMFPPTMALYSCITKQFLQTIKNTIACLQSASEIHQLNAANHVKTKNNNSLTNGSALPPTTSIGQFTSLLLTFDEKQVTHVIDTILSGYPNIENQSQLKKIEIFLTIVTSLTTVPSTPLRSPETIFDPIPLPEPVASVSNSVDNIFNQTNGTLINFSKETHIKLDSVQKNQEINEIAKYLYSFSTHKTDGLAPSTSKSNNNIITYLPTIVTDIDSDYTPQIKVQDEAKYIEDGNEVIPAHLNRNNSSVMIFVSAETLPRVATFELCSVGITNHMFKALEQRNNTQSKILGKNLRHLYCVIPNLTNNDEVFIVFGIFIYGVYLDFAIFNIGNNLDDNVNVKVLPHYVFEKIYTTTGCVPSHFNLSSSYDDDIVSKMNLPRVDMIQSQLFLPKEIITNGNDGDNHNEQTPTIQQQFPHTNIYPSTQLFDGLNLNIAKIYANSYFRLLHQKSKQIESVNTIVAKFLNDKNANNDKISPNNNDDDHADVVNQMDFAELYYPRPTKSIPSQSHGCLCHLIDSNIVVNQNDKNDKKCPICQIGTILNRSNKCFQIYHGVLSNLDVATEYNDIDSE